MCLADSTLETMAKTASSGHGRGHDGRGSVILAVQKVRHADDRVASASEG